MSKPETKKKIRYSIAVEVKASSLSGLTSSGSNGIAEHIGLYHEASVPPLLQAAQYIALSRKIDKKTKSNAQGGKCKCRMNLFELVQPHISYHDGCGVVDQAQKEYAKNKFSSESCSTQLGRFWKCIWSKTNFSLFDLDQV